MATTTLTPAATTYRSSPVRLADDDRSQEDRDHVRDQLVHLLLHRRHPGPGRPDSSSRQPGLQFVTDLGYNELFTMHATFMIFLFVIPMLAGFGNYVVPLQIGAPDMAFPRINALSLWMLPLAGVLLLLGLRDRRHRGGRLDELSRRCPRTRPLAATGSGQDLWIVALVLIGTSSILGAINFLVTIFKMRAPGHDPLPDADHGLDRAGHLGPRADGHAGHHQRPDHAVHRPQLRRRLLRPAHTAATRSSTRTSSGSTRTRRST